MTINKNAPTHEDLFGPTAASDADESRTVLAPGAYLADLLQLLEDAFSSRPDFFLRRPDIERLPLDADNTFSLVPYLEVVNELLEARVREHSGLAPYEALNRTKAPFLLPFDLDSERVELFLSFLKTTPRELHGLFTDEPDLDQVARERLGLSPAAARVVTGHREPGETVESFYGVPEGSRLLPGFAEPEGPPGPSDLEQSADVGAFLAATGLSPSELDELLFQQLSDTAFPEGGDPSADPAPSEKARANELFINHALGGAAAVATPMTATLSVEDPSARSYAFRVDDDDEYRVVAAGSPERSAAALAELWNGTPELSELGTAAAYGATVTVTAGLPRIGLRADSDRLAGLRSANAALTVEARPSDPRLVWREDSPEGLSPAVAPPAEWFDRVHRFVRLSRWSGIGFTDLDRILRTCCRTRVGRVPPAAEDADDIGGAAPSVGRLAARRAEPDVASAALEVREALSIAPDPRTTAVWTPSGSTSISTSSTSVSTSSTSVSTSSTSVSTSSSSTSSSSISASSSTSSTSSGSTTVSTSVEVGVSVEVIGGSGGGQPPTGEPPTSGPPAVQPPTSGPPGGQPPTSGPPGGQPPTTEPPAVQPPTSGPPTGQPPTGRPPESDGPWRILLNEWSLRRVAIVYDTHQRFDLPLEQVCALFADLDDLGIGDADGFGELAEDPFDKVFNGRRARIDGTYLRSGRPLRARPHADLAPATFRGDLLHPDNRDYRLRLQRTLGLSASDLEAAVRAFREHDGPGLFAPTPADPGGLSLAALSLLFRLSTLSNVLDLSVAEVLLLLDVLGGDPTIRRANWFGVLIHEPTEEMNCHRILAGSNLADRFWLVQVLLAIGTWLQEADLTAEALRDIVAGPPRPASEEDGADEDLDDAAKKARKARAEREIAFYNDLVRRFEPAALTPETLESAELDPRAARLFHDRLLQPGRGLVSDADPRLVTGDDAAAEDAAYRSVLDLAAVRAPDLRDLELVDRVAEAMHSRLVLHGWIDLENVLDDRALPEEPGSFVFTTDFSAVRPEVHGLIADLYDAAAAETAPGDEVEFSVFPSDLLDLPLSESERDELYGNLVFVGHLDEQGTALSPEFFADRSRVDEFELDTGLGLHAPLLHGLLAAAVRTFDEQELRLTADDFSDLPITPRAVDSLIENLVFNGYLDEDGVIQDLRRIEDTEPATFELALPYYPHRKAILGLLQGRIEAARVAALTLRAEDLRELSADVVSEAVHQRLSEGLLVDGFVPADLHAFFLQDPDGPPPDLGAYLSEADNEAVFSTIRGILLDAERYRLTPGGLRGLEFDEAESEELIEALRAAGLLRPDGSVPHEHLATFSNINAALVFSVENFEDYGKDVFFLIRDAALRHLEQIDVRLGRLGALRDAQRAAAVDGLAEHLELSPPVTEALFDRMVPGAPHAVEAFLAPVLGAVDSLGRVEAPPADGAFLLTLRRLEQFALLASQWGLDARQVEVVFKDQSLFHKFPERPVLPVVNGRRLDRIDAVLTGLDDQIRVFRDGLFWAFDATTYAPLGPGRPIAELGSELASVSRVDAAFTDRRGDSWIFAGKAIFKCEAGKERWASVQRTWGRIDNDFDDADQIEAAITDADGRVCLFAGDQYVRYRVEDLAAAGPGALPPVEEGYPRSIGAYWSSEVAESPAPPGFDRSVDAALHTRHRETILFREGSWVSSEAPDEPGAIAERWGRVENRFEDLRRVDGAGTLALPVPGPTSEAGWAGPDRRPVHCLFRDGQILACSDSLESPDLVAAPGYPLPIARLFGPAAARLRHVDAAFVDFEDRTVLVHGPESVRLEAGGASAVLQNATAYGRISNKLAETGEVDAAFAGLDGRVYVFSHDEYLRYSGPDYSVADEGYPRRIATDWGGLKRVEAGFVLDGRTYLFEPAAPADPASLDPEPQRRYLRLSTRDYSKLDEGYPRPVDDDFWNLPQDLLDKQQALDDSVDFQRPDAVMNGPQGRTTLFSGRHFVAHDHNERWWSEPERISDHFAGLPEGFDGVAAGFGGKDGRIYLFVRVAGRAEHQVVRYTDPTHQRVDDRYPRPARRDWGRVVNNLERTGRIDAAVRVEDLEVPPPDPLAPPTKEETGTPVRRLYLFSGDQFTRFTEGSEASRAGVADPGYPRPIATSLTQERRFRHLEADLGGGIDGAMADDRNVFLVQGDRIHVASTRPHAAYPGNPYAAAFVEEGSLYLLRPRVGAAGWAFAGLPEAGPPRLSPRRPAALRPVPLALADTVQVILQGADGNTYLFGDGRCFDTALDRDYATGEAWGLARNRIRRENRVDAALTGRDGRVYLFRGDQFVTYSWGADEVGPLRAVPERIHGGPRPVAEHWGGLSDVHAAFVRDGRTFVMEAPDADGIFRYVTYSGEDYSVPDSEPQVADFSFWGLPAAFVAEGFDSVDTALMDGDDLVLIRGREFVLLDGRLQTWSHPRPVEVGWEHMPEKPHGFEDIRCAFKGPDDTLYFFGEGDWVAHRDGAFRDPGGAATTTPTPRRIDERWGEVDCHVARHGQVDAAAVLDGRTYLFAGDQYVRYSDDTYDTMDVGYPKPIAAELRKEAPFAAFPESIEAVFESLLDEAAVAAGRRPRRGITAVWSDEGTVSLLIGDTLHVASAAPVRVLDLSAFGRVRNELARRNRVDAAFSDGDRLFLLSGDQYVRYSGRDTTWVDPGYPRRIEGNLPAELGGVQPALPGPSDEVDFRYDIDAAFLSREPDPSDPSGPGRPRLWLFKDAHWTSLPAGASGWIGPETVRRSGWGRVENEFGVEGENVAVDAVFEAPSGAWYVFRGAKYLRYTDPASPTVDEGYPKAIRDRWGDLPPDFEAGIDGAFVLDGRTYLTLDGPPARTVRYSDPSYARIDPVFPQLIADRWAPWNDYLLSDLLVIRRYRDLADRKDDDGLTLTDFLLDDKGRNAEPYALLAGIFGWDIDDVRWLKRRDAFQTRARPGVMEVEFQLELILRMERVLGVVARLGSHPARVHRDLWSPLYGAVRDAGRAADTLYEFLATLNEGEDWTVLERQLRDELHRLRRDALVAYNIACTRDVANARDLSQLLLIDVETDSCAETSRVREALSAAQLFMHRFFLNLELVDLRGDEDEARRAELKERWRWMKNYRVWEANRKVFLFPENYIRPELRDTKTPAFEELETALLQGELNDRSALQAFRGYLDEYTKVSTLSVRGGFVRSAVDDIDDLELVLFGRTTGEPKRYFYRTATFPRGDTSAAEWRAWRPTEIEIHAERVHPVRAFGRIFVIWWEVGVENDPADRDSEIVEIEGEAGGKKTRKLTNDSNEVHLLRLRFSYLDLNERFTQPQDLGEPVRSPRPFTAVKLTVKASDRRDAYKHDNIVVGCRYSTYDRVPRALLISMPREIEAKTFADQISGADARVVTIEIPGTDADGAHRLFAPLPHTVARTKLRDAVVRRADDEREKAGAGATLPSVAEFVTYVPRDGRLARSLAADLTYVDAAQPRVDDPDFTALTDVIPALVPGRDFVVALSGHEQSSDGPWFAFEHQGGGFLCKPTEPSLPRDAELSPLSELELLPDAWRDAGRSVDAALRLPVEVGGQTFLFSNGAPAEVSVDGGAPEKLSRSWGHVDNAVARGHDVHAAWARGDELFLVSGASGPTEYLVHRSDGLVLDGRRVSARRGPFKLAGNPHGLAERVDSYLTLDGSTVRFVGAAFQTLPAGVSSPTEADWGTAAAVESRWGRRRNPFTDPDVPAPVLGAFRHEGALPGRRHIYLISEDCFIRHDEGERSLCSPPQPNDLSGILLDLGIGPDEGNKISYRGKKLTAAFAVGPEVFLIAGATRVAVRGGKATSSTIDKNLRTAFVWDGRAVQVLAHKVDANVQDILETDREGVRARNRIDAAFVDEDGVLHLFSGRRTKRLEPRGGARVADELEISFAFSRVAGAGEPIEDRWGTVSTAFLRAVRAGGVRVAVRDHLGTITLIAGDHYVRYSAGHTHFVDDDGGPDDWRKGADDRLVVGNSDGLPDRARISAAAAFGGTTHWFLGDGTCVDASEVAATDRPTIAHRWGLVDNNILRQGIDAAYAAGDDVVVISGDEVSRRSARAGGLSPWMDAGHPIRHPGAPKVSAAFTLHGVTYLFAPQADGQLGYTALEGPERANPNLSALRLRAVLGNWGNLLPEFSARISAALSGVDELTLFHPTGYFTYALDDPTSRTGGKPEPYAVDQARYDVIRLTTSTAAELNLTLLERDVDGLLSLRTQEINELPAFVPVGTARTATVLARRSQNAFAAGEPMRIEYVDERVGQVPVDSHLDFGSANGIYYWEVFFHAPFLIAQALNSAQRFEEANDWYERIYDPTDADGPWRFLPFLAADPARLASSIRRLRGRATGVLAADRTTLADLATELEAYSPAFQGAGRLTASQKHSLRTLESRHKLEALQERLESLAGAAEDARRGPLADLAERVALVRRLARLHDALVPSDEQITTYLEDPFDPHAIARLRRIAYRRSVVMRSIDNLLDWGDQHFTRYTIESIEEARALYLHAWNLLGGRPEALGLIAPGPAVSYGDLQDRDDPGEPYDFLLFPRRKGSGSGLPELSWSARGLSEAGPRPYFSIPENTLFLEYWDRVQDRLHKIRHCLNILGVKQPLPLFEPPIDPMALVRAAAGGGGFSAALDGLSVPVPHYRFTFMLDKARELANKVAGFASELLQAIESADAEELNRLQNAQEIEILELTEKIREAQVEEAEKSLEGLRVSRREAEMRRDTYQRWIKDGQNAWEQGQQGLMWTSVLLYGISALLKTASSIAHGIPQALLGVFITGVKTGGDAAGEVLDKAAEVPQSFAEGLEIAGEALGLQGQFQRSLADWGLQAATAESDMQQLDLQIRGGELQVHAAEQEAALVRKQIEHSQAIAKHYRDKFGNRELYLWMAGRLGGLYFQTYKLALDMARAAERAYQFERGVPQSAVAFVQGQYWDSARKGLLAGQTLQLDLDRMEAAWLRSDGPRFEISRDVSLLQHDPMALSALRTTGRCEFHLTEAMYDYDFPGHYRRQLKTVAVTLDFGEGVKANAMLTQLAERTLIEPDPKGVKYLLQPEGLAPPSVRSNWRPLQQIALSHHDEYEPNNGMFESRLDSERFLPFEGTGAVSTWRLEIQGRRSSYDLGALADVVVHVKYLADQGGEAFAQKVRGMLKPTREYRLFDLAADFGEAWEAFLASDDDTLTLELSPDLFPDMSGGRIPAIFARYTLAGEGAYSFLLQGDPDLQLRDGKTLDTSGLSISSRGTRLRLVGRGDKELLENARLVFAYKASVR